MATEEYATIGTYIAAIQDRVVIELLYVDASGEVDLLDYWQVRKYAYHHQHLRLAGWLSQNRYKYDALYAAFLDAFQPQWVDEAVTPASNLQQRIRELVKPYEA